MKHTTFLITLFLGLSLLGCGQAGRKNSSTQSNIIVDSNSDKEQIGNLVKQVLKRHEKNSVLAGFEPIFNPKDISVIDMDLNKLKPELKKTFRKSKNNSVKTCC